MKPTNTTLAQILRVKRCADLQKEKFIGGWFHRRVIDLDLSSLGTFYMIVMRLPNGHLTHQFIWLK